MASIYFAGPYKPIMCGIADYTAFLTGRCMPNRWGVLSFNLEKYGNPLTNSAETGPEHAWYGIPDRVSYSANEINKGLAALRADKRHAVVWFQHEFGIWPDRARFITMLKELDVPCIVSFHTLHFQSHETRYGLRRDQVEFLEKLLPHAGAITVFSRGVRQAVNAFFPEYRDRVFVLKHGVHSYPEIRGLSRKLAREKLNDYLLHDSGIDQKTRKTLQKQSILLDPETIIIGQTGFLSPAKGSELLYVVRNNLEMAIPGKKIAALRIGGARDSVQKMYAEKLRWQVNGKPNFLIDVWLPQNILPLAQRAFDINFYWPTECTQSGVLAHALGAGSIVAGRDLEGVGETLKDAGALTDTSLPKLEAKMKALLLNPELAQAIEQKTVNYAREFSWDNQACRHFELAEHVLAQAQTWAMASSYSIDSALALKRPAELLKSASY
jgi:hypothetical protein